MDEVILKLEEFLELVKCEDDLPYLFDDTLIDKLIDNIIPTGELIEHLLNIIGSDLYNEYGAAGAKILLRLLGKCATIYLDLLATKDDLIRTLINFVRSLDEPVPVDDALALLIPIVRYHMKMGMFDRMYTSHWESIINWTLDVLPEESLSLFVRNRIECFVLELPIQVGDHYTMLFSSSLSGELSPIVRESYHRMLNNFLEKGPLPKVDTLQLFANSIRVNRTMTEASIHLMGKILEKMSSEFATQTLLHSEWKSEIQRLNAIAFYVERVNDRSPEMFQFLLNSPQTKLNHFIQVFKGLDSKQDFLKRLFDSTPLIERIFKQPRPPVDLMLDFVQLLCSRFACSLPECRDILILSLKPILTKTSAFAFLVSHYGLTQLMKDEQLWKGIEDSIQLGLYSNDWGLRDSAIDVISCCSVDNESFPFGCHMPRIASYALTDSCSYVRASSIRCIAAVKYSRTIEVVCERLLFDPDPQPRLEAIHVLKDHVIASPDCQHFLVENLSKLLSEEDYEVRRALINICDLLIKQNNLEEVLARNIRTELIKWTCDMEIGDQVRSVLSIEPDPPRDVVTELLVDMIRAMKLGPECDYVDCY